MSSFANSTRTPTLSRDLFHQFLTQALAPFDSAAVVSGEGEILEIKYESLADIGTIGSCASTVIRYFPLRMGEAVLVNDPYSGGTTLSMLTLVTPLIRDNELSPDLFLAVRLGFRARLVFSKSLEEEGLRIPPTPIAHNRALNLLVVGAIEAHPQAPRNLRGRLESALELMWRRADTLKALLQRQSDLCSRQSIKTYLTDSRDNMFRMLSEWPTGESKSESRWESGELVRLRLELSPERILFDFAGTTTSKRICLTDAATFGTCFGAVAAFLQKPVLLNSGTLSLLQVNTPVGSLLNAKYPSPTYRGMTEGCTQIAGQVIRTLSDIVPQNRLGQAAQSPTQIALDFGSGSGAGCFFDSIPGGNGASAHSDGEMAVPLWTRNGLRNSVQEIESRFPLRLECIRERLQSGGAGRFQGGSGLIKEYRVLQPATLRWLQASGAESQNGQKGGSPGLAGEILVTPPNQTPIRLAPWNEGEMKLEPNSVVSVQTAGGGGYGPNSAKEFDNLP